MRWCLLSGGSYRHNKISKVEIAKTICNGLEVAGFIGNVKIALPIAENAFKEARPYEYKRQKLKESELTESTGDNTMSALVTSCKNESVNEQCEPCKGGPFKIIFPETITHYRPDACVSNCSWNGTEENLCRTCIPVLGCSICKDRLEKVLSSNPVEYNSQWKIKSSYIQDVDETLCYLRKKRIQVLRTRQEGGSNDSLANNIANCQGKTKHKETHLNKKVRKYAGEKSKEKLNKMQKYGPLRLAGDDCDAWKMLTTNENEEKTVSYSDMHATIQKRINMHDERALSQLRRQGNDKFDSGARPRSNKAGSIPAFSSMGGIGTRHSSHRVKNVRNNDSGYYNLPHQELLRQALGAVEHPQQKEKETCDKHNEFTPKEEILKHRRK